MTGSTITKFDKGQLDSVANQIDYCDQHLNGATVERVAAQLDLTPAEVRQAVKQLGDEVVVLKDPDTETSHYRLKQ